LVGVTGIPKLSGLPVTRPLWPTLPRPTQLQINERFAMTDYSNPYSVTYQRRLFHNPNYYSGILWYDHVVALTFDVTLEKRWIGPGVDLLIETRTIKCLAH